MNLKTFTLLGVICTSVVFTSCKKDDDDKKEEPPSVEGTWKITALTITTHFAGTDSTEDYFATYSTCEKDNLTRYNADKTITYLGGATKCKPNEVESMPIGTWALSANDTKLTISYKSTTVWDITTLNATTLKLQVVETNNGATYTTKITYARQ